MARTRKAYLAFKSPPTLPSTVIQLSNGVMLDLASNQVIVEGDFSLHSTGNIRLSSDEHVIVESGRGFDDRGEVQGIWLNPVYDDSGQPIEVADEIELEVIDDEEPSASS